MCPLARLPARPAAHSPIRQLACQSVSVHSSARSPVLRFAHRPIPLLACLPVLWHTWPVCWLACLAACPFAYSSPWPSARPAARTLVPPPRRACRMCPCAHADPCARTACLSLVTCYPSNATASLPAPVPHDSFERLSPDSPRTPRYWEPIAGMKPQGIMVPPTSEVFFGTPSSPLATLRLQRTWVFAPVRLFDSAGNRIYTEMNSGDW